MGWLHKTFGHHGHKLFIAMRHGLVIVLFLLPESIISEVESEELLPQEVVSSRQQVIFFTFVTVKESLLKNHNNYRNDVFVMIGI